MAAPFVATQLDLPDVGRCSRGPSIKKEWPPDVVYSVQALSIELLQESRGSRGHRRVATG